MSFSIHALAHNNHCFSIVSIFVLISLLSLLNVAPLGLMCLPLTSQRSACLYSVSWLFVFSLFLCLNFDCYKWTAMNVTHQCFVFHIILLKYKTMYTTNSSCWTSTCTWRAKWQHIHTYIYMEPLTALLMK